jgi:hypothetical protein
MFSAPSGQKKEACRKRQCPVSDLLKPFSPHWVPTLRRLNIPIYCHANTIDALALCSRELVPLIRSFDVDAFSPIDGLRCDPIHFAHDRLGSHGFAIDGFGDRIGYATDLGHVPSYFYERFRYLSCIYGRQYGVLPVGLGSLSLRAVRPQ